MACFFNDNLGEELIKGKEGMVSTKSALSGKYVLLYFSAHWCPPCRGFTPKLAAFYTNLKKNRDDVEVVFVSSDRDEKSFDDYFSEMPWLSLPFSKRDVKKELSQKYKVNGIPSLVVLDKDGTIVTDDGRSSVMEDPEGKKFPWFPPKFEEVFPTSLMSKSGEVLSSTLDDKYLLIYFSAHWCPPCRGYTPELSKVYEKLKATRDDFEIVFASSDRDEKSFDEYYSEMAWMSVPFANREAKNALSKIFSIEGIPSLVVLSKKNVDGKRKLINGKARGDASMDNIAEFPWQPKPYTDLSKGVDCNGSDINESTSIIVLCEGADDDEQKEIVQNLKQVAEKMGSSDLLFFYGCENKGPVPRVRQLLKQNDPEKVVLLKLDIPDGGGYYVSDENDLTNAETIENFVKSSGNRQQLD